MCSRAALLGQGRRGLKISISWTRPEKEERKAFVVDAKQTIDNVIQINGVSRSVRCVFVVRAIVIVGSWLRSRDGRIGCGRAARERMSAIIIDGVTRQEWIGRSTHSETVMQEVMGTACRGYRKSSSAGSRALPSRNLHEHLRPQPVEHSRKLVHCVTPRLDKYNSFPLCSILN